MKKITLLFLVIHCLSFQLLQAQSIPTAPNKTDTQGKRQGKWVILYDKDWKIAKDTSQAQFYRVISYKDDLPVGKVRDYYLSGKIQWEGRLLKDRPKEIKEGQCTWYYESTKIKEIGWFDNEGELIKWKSFDEQGSVKDQGFSASLFKKATDLVIAQRYQEALKFFETHKEAILQSYENNSEFVYIYYKILSVCYENTGQLAKAKAVNAMLVDLREGVKNSYVGISLEAYKALENGRLKKALRLYKKASKKAKKMGKANYVYGVSLMNLGKIYFELADFKNADKLFVESLKILYQNRDISALMIVKVMNLYGFLKMELGQYHKADSLFNKSLELFKESKFNEASPYAETLTSLAKLYQTWGKYDQAEAYCKRALEVEKKTTGIKSLDYNLILTRLASLYSTKGNYNQADSIFSLVLPAIDRLVGKRSFDYTDALDGLAYLRLQQGLYKEAIKLYKQSLEIKNSIEGKNELRTLTNLANLGAIHGQLGNYEEAERLIKEGMSSVKLLFGRYNKYYLNLLGNLTELYVKQNKFLQVEPIFDTIQKVTEKTLGINHPDYVLFLNNKAMFLIFQGQPEKSLDLILQAKKLVKALGKQHPLWHHINNSLSTIYIRLGRYNEAENILLKSLKFLKESDYNKQNLIYLSILGNLSAIYLYEREFSKAGEIANETREIIKSSYGEQSAYYLMITFTLANINMAQAHYITAEELFKEVLTLTDRKSLYSVEAITGLIYIYTFQKRDTETANIARELMKSFVGLTRDNYSVLDERSRLLFFKSNIQDPRKAILSFFYKHIQSQGIRGSIDLLINVYNNHIFSKSLLFQSSQKVKKRIKNRGDKEAINDYQKFVASKVYLNRVLEMPPAKRASENIDLKKIRDDVDLLERRLARKSKEFTKVLDEYKPKSWEDVKDRLNSGEVAIELI
ncbi:MAG TPA: hypothetical protein DCS93_12815, partial [Microscillaceae bacterium]|nr:hypothetical protein [Microscillaceae bacterium]